MDDDIKHYTEIVVNFCLVFYQKIQIVGNNVL